MRDVVGDSNFDHSDPCFTHGAGISIAAKDEARDHATLELVVEVSSSRRIGGRGNGGANAPVVSRRAPTLLVARLQGNLEH